MVCISKISVVWPLYQNTNTSEQKADDHTIVINKDDSIEFELQKVERNSKHTDFKNVTHRQDYKLGIISVNIMHKLLKLRDMQIN